MIKINPIRNIKPSSLENLKYIANTKINTKMPAPLKPAVAVTLAASGIVASTFLKDYKKTADEENYFQFKTNPETGKHFNADVFQNAAGMNLYLGNDVLVTAPTGTGKTAIAEYVITKNLKDGKRTFYTTPLKALSNEKFLDFSKVYGEENVGLITGDTKINTTAPIIIMTTEVYRNMAAKNIFDFKADSSLGLPQDLKTVIFDELQYLGDIDRGGIWEQSIMFTPKNVQMLSLSATIGNNEEINDWMAHVKHQESIKVTPDKKYLPTQNSRIESVLVNVPPENRHVPLNFEVERVPAEIAKIRGGSKKEKIKAKKEAAQKATSAYAKPSDQAFKNMTRKLYLEDKLPAIYFVFSKKDSRHLLKFLSRESEILTTEAEKREIGRIIKRYRQEGLYLGESLNYDALFNGYAVHNAGLLPTQKRLVEELFQKKLVKVVLATETLAAGINMPARTTVISSPRKPASTSDGGDDKKRGLTPNEFHQMAGRAGRRGIDTIGYCYPMSCNQEQTKLYEALMQSPSNPLKSNLELDFSFIANYMAEFISDEELEYILSKSLYTYNKDGKIDTENLKKITENYKVKKDILTKQNFIDENGRITIKGELIKVLNGYEQIPIINMIANKSFAKLNPKQLAGIVAGLANIEYSTKGEFPQKPFEIKRCDDGTLIQASEQAFKEVKAYENSISKIYPTRELEFSSKAIDHVYTWAELNSENDDSKDNWKKLYSGELRFTIKDEGSLFKEITMTTDLLKQLINVAREGYALSADPYEQEYYQNLAEKLEVALSLIQREPASDKSI